MKFTEMPEIPRNSLQFSGVFAALVLGLTLNSVQVQAQEQDDNNTGNNDADMVLEEVIVSGTRRALQNSIEIKRAATGIVDAMSMGDIGDIPSLSVGEAIEQITGATGHIGGNLTRAGRPTASCGCSTWTSWRRLAPIQ